MNRLGQLTTLGAALLLIQSAHAVDRIAYGSTAIGSIHYTYAVSAAKAINTHAADKVNVTVLATGGAVDNLARLARGQINFGLGTFETIYQAYKGLAKFSGQPAPKLRILWVHSASLQFYVVRADSGVKTLADLTGKKFTAGQRGSATENIVQQILASVDVKPDYFVATLSDAVAAVKDGRSIGYVKAGSRTSLDGTTLELRTLTPINVLGFSPEQVTKVHAKLPYVAFATLGPNSVEGVGAITTPVQTIGEFAYSDSLTDEQAMAILDGLMKGQDVQAAAFPDMKGMDIPKETLIAAGALNIPLHRGAVKFYQAHGYKVADNLIPPEAKSR
jgi:TRAP transporter TAXI family solute receptor